MSSKQTKRSFEPTPGKLSQHGLVLGVSAFYVHDHNKVKIYLPVDPDSIYEATVNGIPVRGKWYEVIAAIDGKALPTGPQAPQHIRTAPKE